jgi:hypothetical protein
MDNTVAITRDLLLNTFEVEPVKISENPEEIFEQLTSQIAWMIEHKLDFLLSLLYRLDVAEEKINLALTPQSPIPADQALALLILERQKQRMETKERYRQFTQSKGENDW